MLIDWTLTADAVATLIAGLVAFVAVIVQIRSSSTSVRAQIDAENKARWEEESRRTRALARALLFEVVNFYRYCQKQIRSQLDGGESLGVRVPTLSVPGAGSFAVYHGNAGKLGEFDNTTVESVVSFDIAAQWFVSTVESYQTNLWPELALNKSLQPGSAPLTLLARLRDQVPHLDQAALTACQNLCKVAAIEFDSLELTR